MWKEDDRVSVSKNSLKSTQPCELWIYAGPDPDLSVLGAQIGQGLKGAA